MIQRPFRSWHQKTGTVVPNPETKTTTNEKVPDITPETYHDVIQGIVRGNNKDDGPFYAASPGEAPPNGYPPIILSVNVQVTALINRASLSDVDT